MNSRNRRLRAPRDGGRNPGRALGRSEGGVARVELGEALIFLPFWIPYRSIAVHFFEHFLFFV